MTEMVQTTLLNQGISAALSALVIVAIIVVGRMAYKYLPDFLRRQNELREQQITATVTQSDLIKDYIKQVDSNNTLLRNSQAIHHDMSEDLSEIKQQMEAILTRILAIEKQCGESVNQGQFNELIEEFRKLAEKFEKMAKERK